MPISLVRGHRYILVYCVSNSQVLLLGRNHFLTYDTFFKRSINSKRPYCLSSQHYKSDELRWCLIRTTANLSGRLWIRRNQFWGEDEKDNNGNLSRNVYIAIPFTTKAVWNDPSPKPWFPNEKPKSNYLICITAVLVLYRPYGYTLRIRGSLVIPLRSIRQKKWEIQIKVSYNVPPPGT